MGEIPLALDDISELWPARPEGAFALRSTGQARNGSVDAGKRPTRPAPVAYEANRAEARLERVVAQLSHRLDALAREVAVLAAATKAQGDRLAALEESVRESMLLVAAAIDRPVRR